MKPNTDNKPKINSEKPTARQDDTKSLEFKDMAYLGAPTPNNLQMNEFDSRRMSDNTIN